MSWIIVVAAHAHREATGFVWLAILPDNTPNWHVDHVKEILQHCGEYANLLSFQENCSRM